MSVSVAALASSGIHFSQGVPRLALALEPATTQGRKILALGALPKTLERALDAAGARVAPTATVLEAHRAMAAQTFDAVLVAPEAPGAIELVKSVKLGAGGASLRSIADRHAHVPFFVLPFVGETEYAVIVEPPGLAYLEDERTTALADAVLRLDAWRLAKGGRA